MTESIEDKVEDLKSVLEEIEENIVEKSEFWSARTHYKFQKVSRQAEKLKTSVEEDMEAKP